ncbi:MAG: MBL fold metallo-hydrolase [Oligoflexales bacterium]
MSYKIHVLKGYIQTIYLIEESNGLFLLDGCCRPDVPTVLDFINKNLHRSVHDLKLVIATHAHPDHAGGLYFFQKLGIPIAGPVNLNSWYKGISGLIKYLVDILLTYLVAIIKKQGLKNVFYPRSFRLDYELKDSDIIPYFGAWCVIETPGHTALDLSIYHSQTNLIYIADNFVLSKGKLVHPYPLCYPEKYKISLKKYLDMEIHKFLLAHYGQIKISKDQIESLIRSTPKIPRIHRNSLSSILLKLCKGLLKLGF